MIATYFTMHRAELKGAAGPAGTAGKAGDAGSKGDKGDQGDRGEKGEKGDIGPQGPGAIDLVHTGSAAESGSQPVATVGPWNVTLTCNPDAPNSTLTIKGPGELTQSSVLAGGSPTMTSGSTTSGANIEVSGGPRRAVTGFLVSGSTTYELNIQTWAESGLFEICRVVGDAIAVPSAN